LMDFTPDFSEWNTNTVPKGTRFMICGHHLFAGWIGRYLQLKLVRDEHLFPLLELEGHPKGDTCVVYLAHELRFARDDEFGLGGKPRKFFHRIKMYHRKA
jgi:hypothetical protein